jgi:hypothetical protein
MFDSLQEFVASLPPLFQWLGVMLIAAIPFVESYFGSAIGVLAGIPPVLAVSAAVAGNVASMLAFVYSASGVRRRVARGGTDDGDDKRAAKRQKLRRAFDRYGIAGVSLLGQTILPSQITSAALVSFGANRRLVIIWQIVSIILWGTVFGLLATLGVNIV